ncbi:hypothetical protein DY000_02015804 [Brassica cretica]|uniref:Uncharacterized protein n=1 Tax=Brassica cretica TaxID=69181 RepID=A0ABQ7CQ98_BRACR|nr:hypothetical protein DY000_02015804 [Brassica cretica]
MHSRQQRGVFAEKRIGSSVGASCKELFESQERKRDLISNPGKRIGIITRGLRSDATSKRRRGGIVNYRFQVIFDSCTKLQLVKRHCCLDSLQRKMSLEGRTAPKNVPDSKKVSQKRRVRIISCKKNSS